MLASISSNVQVSTNEWMRSREPMGKCRLHFGQTFEFSSSSLSKIIVSHVGHFTQSPSGMSRFFVLDFPEPRRGFLGSAVILCAGGVNAGSITSMPIDFFVNEVVSMNVISLLNSKPARNSPDTNIARAGL